MKRTVVDDEADEASDSTASARRALAETRHLLREADRLWAPFSCAGTAECCQLSATGRPPWLWPSEWAVLRQHLTQTGRSLPHARPDGGCPFLDDAGKRCTVYLHRPLGCRTFFCERVAGPSRIPAGETHGLWDRLAALNLALDARASPRSLWDWWKAPPPA